MSVCQGKDSWASRGNKAQRMAYLSAAAAYTPSPSPDSTVLRVAVAILVVCLLHFNNLWGLLSAATTGTGLPPQVSCQTLLLAVWVCGRTGLRAPARTHARTQALLGSACQSSTFGLKPSQHMLTPCICCICMRRGYTCAVWVHGLSLWRVGMGGATAQRSAGMHWCFLLVSCLGVGCAHQRGGALQPVTCCSWRPVDVCCYACKLVNMDLQTAIGVTAFAS